MRIRAVAGAIVCWALLGVSVPASANEFIAYSFQVTNVTENPQQFTFSFLSPYAFGPYDTLYTEFDLTITDNDSSGGGNVSPADASGFMAIPSIDAVNILAGALGDGCAVLPAPGATVPCDPFSTATVGVSTAANGFFGVTVSFFLTGGDRANGSGRVELRTGGNVPEPVSALLLGLGLAVTAARRRLAR